MVSVVGLGFVGSSLFKSFQLKNINPLFGYDKYKNYGSLQECMQSSIMFLCLPTLYDHNACEYDKSAIYETLNAVADSSYKGIVVIKSTVEPGTTEQLSKSHPGLSIIHNPEFLSAATAFYDFHNQEHVVIGRGRNCSNEQVKSLYDFYVRYYGNAEISECTSTESESMKAFVNSFYSVKIQFFNEMYLLCQSQKTDFNRVKQLMLKNKWINPMHTTVPGHDGRLSYGGACFPKDTNALLQCMKRNGTPHALLEGCVRERNILRNESELNEKINDHNEAGIKKKNRSIFPDIHQKNLFNVKIADHVYGDLLESVLKKDCCSFTGDMSICPK